MTGYREEIISKRLINSIFLQRIVGRDVTKGLQQFGAALLRYDGLVNDVDENHYPDIVVSATKSDDVIVLRSKPVVVVTADLRVSPTIVNVVECLRNANQPCVTLELLISAKEATISDGRRTSFGECSDASLVHHSC